MQHPSAPLVSIIVPSFNQGRFIGETLRSCLEQDYRPIEILVFDGGSTDETVEVLHRFHAPELRWWSERDRGVVDAVNKGLDAAAGEILTIQSSDDVFLPGAVSAAVHAFGAAPGVGLVYGDVDLIDEESRQVGCDIQGRFDLAEYLGRLIYVPQPGAFFSRVAMNAAGRWRNEVSYAADADFWMRIAARHPVLKIDRRLARYRYHADQRDTHRARIERDWCRAVQDQVQGGGLNPRQHRYARMGLHLARHRYADPSDWRARTGALYGALVINPFALLDPRFPKRELLLGRDPIWHQLSRIKRAMGFRARTS